MLNYGKMTHKQACEAMAAHDAQMRKNWVLSCIHFMKAWEKIRTPQRWENMNEFQRMKIIKGWIYQRDILTRKTYV